MKKIFATLLTLSLVVCLFGCSDKTGEADKSEIKSTESTVATEANESVENEENYNNEESTTAYGVPSHDPNMFGGLTGGDGNADPESDDYIGGGGLSIGGGLTLDDGDLSEEIGLGGPGSGETTPDVFVEAGTVRVCPKCNNSGYIICEVCRNADKSFEEIVNGLDSSCENPACEEGLQRCTECNP